MKRKQMIVFLIIIVLTVRITYYFAQPDLCTDHVSQMAMAQNFLEGHGFSFKYLDVQNQIYYKTHIQWPPLYPLIIALITLITSNLLVSSFIIQIVVLLLLLIIWKKTFNLIKNLVSDEGYYYFIAFLIVSTSILNNINTILVFALLLLSLSIYFIFAYLFDSKYKKINLFSATLFAVSLFWTHYSYFLVAFYPAIVLFIIFYSGKNKTYLLDSLKSFIISIVLTFGVLIYNYITTSSINYMDNPALWDAGFFPKHLLLTDPFFLNAFFKSSYIYFYILKTDQNVLLAILFQIISLIIFIGIVVLYIKLRKDKDLPSEKIFQLFIPFFVIIVLTISFLLYFTLHYHEIPRPGWTHIGDPRYLSSVYISIIAIVIILLFIKADYIKKKFLYFIKSVLVLLIFINLSINIYITIKEWGNYSFKADTYKVPEKDLQELYANIKFDLKRGDQPVFIDNDLTVRSFRISQYAGAAVVNSKEANKIDEIPSNFVFYFILPEEKFYRKEDFQLLGWGKKYNLKIIGTVYNNLSLYKVEK